MKHVSLLMLFLFVLLYLSCSVQGLRNHSLVTEELKWKKRWIDIFFREYRDYQEIDLKKCYDNNRNIAFDIERKIRAINEFPFEKTLKELRCFLTVNSIQYDSLIMVNYHSWYNEGDHGLAPVTFFLFHKGEIKLFFLEFDNDQNPRINEKENGYAKYGNVEYENVNKLQNGCGYGFATITYFDRGLSNCMIKRIVINPDE